MPGRIRRASTFCLPVVVAALLWCGSASAHQMRIFATVEGKAIVGECFLSGGARPNDCPVAIFGPGGEKLGETRTDERGAFRFVPGARVDHRIVVDTGDGHRAEFTIKAEDLPASLPQHPDASGPHARHDEDEGEHDLDERIAEAVARQLRPLRRQIDHLEHRIGLRDVLGGLGYIFGLAGVAFYFRRRRCSKE